MTQSKNDSAHMFVGENFETGKSPDSIAFALRALIRTLIEAGSLPRMNVLVTCGTNAEGYDAIDIRIKELPFNVVNLARIRELITQRESVKPQESAETIAVMEQLRRLHRSFRREQWSAETGILETTFGGTTAIDAAWWSESFERCWLEIEDELELGRANRGTSPMRLLAASRQRWRSEGIFGTKTVRVPVIFRGGRAEFFYGGPLPSLADGTIGDLVVPVFALVNPSDQDRLNHLGHQVLFPPGTSLYVMIKPDVQTPKSDVFEDRNIHGTHGWFARITVQGKPRGNQYALFEEPNEGLVMEMRGTKEPRLLDCCFEVPGRSEVARSLNHACTLVSEMYETSRRSHTQNAFKVVHYDPSTDGRRSLRPLEDLRAEIYAKYEQRFVAWDQLAPELGGTR